MQRLLIPNRFAFLIDQTDKNQLKNNILLNLTVFEQITTSPTFVQ